MRGWSRSPSTPGPPGCPGRDLCPVDVLAADQHLTALAQAMKAAGITGTMDTLRAHAYLHLLSGQPASTLLDPAPRPASPGATAPAPAPGPGATSPGTRQPVPGPPARGCAAR